MPGMQTKDLLRLRKREQVKIEAESLSLGLLNVRESQLWHGLRFTTSGMSGANLTPAEVSELAAWLADWAKRQTHLEGSEHAD